MKKMKLILSSQGSVLDWRNGGKGKEILCSELMESPYGSIDGVKEAVRNASEIDTLHINFIPGMDLHGILEQAEGKMNVIMYAENISDVAEELGSYDVVAELFEIHDNRERLKVVMTKREAVKIA